MYSLELYEKKILSDEEMPIQFNYHRVNEKGAFFYRHWHEHLELHYVTKGEGHFELNQETYHASKGTLIIANSNELHVGYCDKGEFEDRAIIFLIDEISKELGDMNLLFQTVVDQDETVERLFQQIYEEYHEKKLGYKQVCRALVTELLVYLSRNYVAEMLTEKDNIRRNKKLERLNKVIMYIEEHYTEPITTKELADLVYLSEDRFGHLFRENMGVAPIQYINEVRLKKAKHLMKRGEYTITEIAEAVGFRDYNHFGRLFKKRFGFTPREM